MMARRRRHSAETKAKMSRAQRRRAPVTEETRKTISAMKTIHGQSKIPMYHGWGEMLRRHKAEVCDRWFEWVSFFEDMGERPEGYQMHRIDRSKDYGPGNCEWARIDK